MAKGRMGTPLRVAVVITGVIFTLQGLGWIYDPAQAAAGLGMPLLDGVGRSTQAGDFASFFLTGGIAILLGSRPGHARTLYFPAALIGGAAITRTLAWALHGAGFAASFIAIEILVGTLLVKAANAGDREIP